MANVQIIYGDLLQSNAPLIVHQVNCMGVMGAGIAKQIKEQYPEVFAKYTSLTKKYPDNVSRLNLLGKAQFVTTKSGIIVVNLFGQLNYGRSGRHTDYSALEKGFDDILNYVIEYDIPEIAMPYRIGCGLAGGDWNIVQSIIEQKFADYDGTVKLYSFSA